MKLTLLLIATLLSPGIYLAHDTNLRDRSFGSEAIADSLKREVEIKTADGVILKGTLYSAHKPGPGILLFHMCDGKGRGAWDTLATELARVGFHVLTFNYRGVGDSGGDKFQGGSMQEVMEYWRTKWGGDAEAALELLSSQPGVNKNLLGVGGASCGVFMSLLLAQRHQQTVKTLVLLAGPADAAAKAFVEKSHGLPILCVGSEDDPRSAAWMKEVSALSQNADTRLVIYKDAGHGTNMFAREKALEPMLVDWFKAKVR